MNYSLNLSVAKCCSEKLYVSNVHSSIASDELKFAFSFYCEVVDAFLESKPQCLYYFNV